MPKIRIDNVKCTGCRLCEMACSFQHVKNTFNPKRSRIRVFTLGDFSYPVIAGPYTEAECTAKHVSVRDGIDFNDCITCNSSCPVKPIFREPDVDIPLKCDFCGEPPDPQCVRVCAADALTLVQG